MEAEGRLPMSKRRTRRHGRKVKTDGARYERNTKRSARAETKKRGRESAREIKRARKGGYGLRGRSLG